VRLSRSAILFFVSFRASECKCTAAGLAALRGVEEVPPVYCDSTEAKFSLPPAVMFLSFATGGRAGAPPVRTVLRGERAKPRVCENLWVASVAGRRGARGGASGRVCARRAEIMGLGGARRGGGEIARGRPVRKD